MNLSKKNIITILLVIILIGIFLRFYKLGELSFSSDEFLDINSTYAYFKTSVWQKWDFNYGQVDTENVFVPRDQRAWIYKWQVAQFFKYFPPTEFTARSVSALWGIFSIILIYFVATYFTKRKEIGLMAAFLFSISISGIEFDRTFRMYAMFFAVFLAFSWFLFRFLEEENIGKNKLIKKVYALIDFNLIYFLPMMVLGIISLMVHQLTANIIFIFGAYAIIQVLLAKKRLAVKKYIVGLLILIVGIIGIFVFLPDTAKEFSAGLTFIENHWSYLRLSFTDYSNIIIGIGFLLLGIYFLNNKGLKKESLWLSVSFIGTLLMAIFIWKRNVGDQYIFFIKSFGIILIASGIYFTAKFFQNNLSGNKKIIFYVSIFLSLLILPNYNYFFDRNNAYHQTSDADTPNYRSIFSYFKKQKNDNDVLITRNFRNYYWSGAKVKVYDFGVDITDEGKTVETKKLTLDQFQKIVSDNPSGWFIAYENDETFLQNGVMDWVMKNLNRVSNPQVRGKISVYHWGN